MSRRIKFQSPTYRIFQTIIVLLFRKAEEGTAARRTYIFNGQHHCYNDNNTALIRRRKYSLIIKGDRYVLLNSFHETINNYLPKAN